MTDHNLDDLIIDNMNHQHVAKNKMDRVDRYRLQEVRGWLLPDNTEAQLFRWYVINNELIRLHQDSWQKRNRPGAFSSELFCSFQ